MSRTKRKIPHWVRDSERLDNDPTFPKNDKQYSTAMDLRTQVRTGNFDMSDKDRSYDIVERQKLKEQNQIVSSKD